MTRPLDRHLDGDELDALVTSHAPGVSGGGRLPEEAVREAQRHVESCQDCDRKVQMHRSAQRAISLRALSGQAARGPNCSDQTEWVQVAAGLLEESNAKERMNHASQCGHCAPLLKAAVKSLSDDTTPDEEAALASLGSARTDWQTQMARTLRGAAELRHPQDSVPSFWRSLSYWLRPAFVAVSVAVIVAAVWIGVHALHPQSAEQLIAQAYTDRRTMDVRISGARYAPIRVERSGANSNFDRPQSLLKAEALVSENLAKQPNDPAWLDARARAEMLDGAYDEAIKTLQRALESQADSPDLLTDLGSAYYLRAKSTDRAIDYGNAIESLSKALAKRPDDPIALFNRALACEQMFLYKQAVDDWEHYLRVDPQGKWAEEARQRLQTVQQNVNRHDQSMAEPLLTPKQVSAARSAENFEVIDNKIERYTRVAIKSWLPAALSNDHLSGGSSEDERRALQRLGQILESGHNDNWLAQFLKNVPSPAEAEALRILIAADDAAYSGSYGHAVELAEQSAREFRAAGNQAGILRAEYEIVYARALTLDFAGCLHGTKALLPVLSQMRFHWLQSATFIEEAECLAGTAQFQQAITENGHAYELARRYGYKDLELRAVAFGANYRSSMSDVPGALQQLKLGLSAYWQSGGSESVGGNLYAVLTEFAFARQWPFVEGFVYEELLARFSGNNPLDRALDLEFLAGAQERSGDYEAAEKSFASAAASIAGLPKDNVVAPRQAEIALGGAEIQLHLGNYRAAIAALAPFRGQLENANAGLFQALYYRTLGEAYLALGETSDARINLELALAETETGLKNLREEPDRLAWSRAESQVYHDLLSIRLKAESPAQAFAWWEWYKSASVRASLNRDAGKSTLDFSSFESALTRTNRFRRGGALISYAVLNRSIVAFVLKDGVVTARELPLPPSLDSLVQHFLENCSDPSTDNDLLNAEGLRLHDMLFAPLESDLAGISELHVETDGILDKVPFSLMHGKNGPLVGDQFEITFAQGLASENPWNRQAVPPPLSRASSALIVVAATPQDSSFAPLPDAAEEGKKISANFDAATVVVSAAEEDPRDLLRILRNVRVFHFAGHAIAAADRVGLVLGHGRLLSARDLALAARPNLALAVLSACDSANGGEGTNADVDSIARNLAAAGVPEIVASRWHVDSAITRQLMVEFYANIMAGKSAADSLRAASVSIRNLPQYRHPYYWASFAVFGNS